MRVSVVFLFVCLLVAGTEAQGGLFSGFMNFVNRFNPFRPRPSSAGRPPANRPPPSFSSAPAPSSFNAAPAPSSFSSGSSAPAAPAFGQQTVVSSNPGPAPVQQPAPAPSSGRGNHRWSGGDYLLSWREGQSALTWGQARQYCAGRGMRIISMDSSAKSRHFLSQMQDDNAPYFWAGGRLSSDKRTLNWENGRSEGIRQGQHPWSFTGSRGAQPDGGRGSENCLAVLNNFYNDGAKYHDVGCSHRKPTVCEA